MSPPDSVVFPVGEHVYANEKGTVTICVPHNVTLQDMMPALCALVGKEAEDGLQKKCAP